MKRAINHALLIVGTLVIASAASVKAFGQTEPDARANERDLEERIFNLGLLRKGKSPDKHSNSQVILAQVQADFTRLQVVDNDLAEVIDRKAPLDLDFVAKSVTEIESLGERLMNNLTQTKPGKDKKGAEAETLADRQQLKQSLAALDKLIVEFTHNPVFKEASADDARLGTKALRDLDQIIKLSGQARKSTEKFARDTQKSP